MLRRVSLAGLCGVAIAAALQTPDPPTPTFHAGTRLVEVEVVVRDKNGPVTGLTRDAFTVLDRGKAQRIDVFHAGQANTAAATSPAPLAPGAVSNRFNSLGEAIPNTTVVLFDQINSRLDLKDYESKAMVKLIRGLGSRDRVATLATRTKSTHFGSSFARSGANPRPGPREPSAARHQRRIDVVQTGSLSPPNVL